MRISKSALMTAGCYGFLVAAGLSQNTEPAAGPLSLDQLVAKALKQNQELLALRQSLAEAQGLLRQAGLRPNPALGFSAAAGDPLRSRGERQFEVSYSHILETAGKRRRHMEAAAVQAEISKCEIADHERRLRAAVQSLYIETLSAMRNLGAAREMLALARKGHSVAQARVREGEGAVLEEGLWRLEVQRLQSEQLLLAGQIERNLLDLGLLVGEELKGELRESDLLSRFSAEVNPEQLLARALAQRSDLQALRLREQLAGVELSLARAQAVPDVELTARFAHVQTRFDSHAFALPGALLAPLRDKDNLVSAGISIPLPARNRNQGNIEASLARQRAALLRRQALERSVRRQVLSAINHYQAARQALDAFEKGAFPQALENLKIVRAAYELGELRLLDLIQEQRKLLEVQRALNGLFREANLAAVELEEAVGGPIP